MGVPAHHLPHTVCEYALPTRILRAIHSDNGAAAVPFIIALPIFLMIVAVLVQYALLLNARTMVQQAAEAAARAAVTSLPDDQPDNVRKAACMALAPLSPQTQGGVSAEAADMADALARVGANVSQTFASRYTYATDATQVSWTGGNFPGRVGQSIEVSVQYRFSLTVPGAATVVAPQTDTVSGVSGRFFTLTAKCQVQTAHSRKAGDPGVAGMQ